MSIYREVSTLEAAPWDYKKYRYPRFKYLPTKSCVVISNAIVYPGSICRPYGLDELLYRLRTYIVSIGLARENLGY